MQITQPQADPRASAPDAGVMECGEEGAAQYEYVGHKGDIENWGGGFHTQVLPSDVQPGRERSTAFNTASERARSSRAEWGQVLEEKRRAVRGGSAVVLSRTDGDTGGCYVGDTQALGGPRARLSGLSSE